MIHVRRLTLRLRLQNYDLNEFLDKRKNKMNIDIHIYVIINENLGLN